MRALFIGLVLGSIAVWVWYQTGGKIHITETKIITNEVIVTITETQLVERVVDVIRTNEVWKTNIAEIIQQPQVVTEKPVVQTQPKTSQSEPRQSKQVTPVKSGLSGPRPSSSAKSGAAAPPPAGGGVMFNDGHGRSYRIVNGRRVYN